ncbi:MAG: hypothetical protein AAB626_01655 [Patescibacteria group bacterium]
MPKEWVYTHMEDDRIHGTSRHPVTRLEAQCMDDAVREGAKLWEERLKNCEDDEGAKRIGDRLFWPSKPKVRLEIPIPTHSY